jgi:phospholipid/cholesterol/gamma-HCH transport system substrate-binding protein
MIMVTPRSACRALVAGCCVALISAGCGFDGVNSLPLPGTVGNGGGTIYHVEITDVGSLEQNSPVMINDVVVGSVGRMKLNGWHADVQVSVRPDVVVPANAVATVGQTSLLGSMHLQLNPPLGEAASGALTPGATIPLNRSTAYPSTEQTLSSLSIIVNAGGLGQIGDIIHSFNGVLSGHESQIRDLLTRLDVFVGTFDRQRDQLNNAIDAMNRLTGTLAGQRDVITRALQKIPPALEVLIRERPRLTAALDKLRVFSNTATGLVHDSEDDLVANLQHLEPTVRALADVGPDLDLALANAPIFPYTQNLIDRAVRGDYINEFVTLDITVPRLKRDLFRGTHWGQRGAPVVPAPGDPDWQMYTRDPLGAPLASPPAAPLPPADGFAQAQAAANPQAGPATPPPPPDGTPAPPVVPGPGGN